MGLVDRYRYGRSQLAHHELMDTFHSLVSGRRRASLGGTYDPRPVFIVKLPGQTVGTRVATPYATVHTRKLLDAIMANQIKTPADLATWAQAPH